VVDWEIVSFFETRIVIAMVAIVFIPINQYHIFVTDLFWVTFPCILPSSTRSTMWSLPLSSSTKILYEIISPVHAAGTVFVI
jgi:hypothetical protein